MYNNQLLYKLLHFTPQKYQFITHFNIVDNFQLKYNLYVIRTFGNSYNNKIYLLKTNGDVNENHSRSLSRNFNICL